MKKSLILAASALLAIFSTGCDQVEAPKEEPKAAPEITKVTPAYGYAGAEVEITGANFSATASENIVTFGEDQAEVKTASETSLTVVVPGDEDHAAGKVTVTVTVEDQSATASFTYLEPEPDPIVLTSIDPAKGPAGTEVTLVGENFGDSADGLVVAFGANAAEIISVSNTQIKAFAPAGDGEVQVIVSKGDLISEALTFTYEYSKVVEVSSIYPLIATEGEEISILGTGFSANADENVVTIGGVAAQVTYASETEGLKILVPALEKGEHKISIATVGAAPVETEAFVYWSLPTYVVSTVIGNGTAANLEGAWTEAGLYLPEDLTWAPDGKLWISTRGGSKETGHHGVHSVDMTTGQLATVVDQSVIGTDQYPWGGDFNSKGEYHVALKNKKSIGKIVDGEWSVYTIEGTELDNPLTVIFDSNDYMYVSDRNNNRIVVSYNGTFTKEYKLDCRPFVVALDSKEENLFVGTNGQTPTNAWVIFKINISSGEITVVAGSRTKPTKDNVTNGEVGNPLTATVGNVSGIVCDKDGYVYYNDNQLMTLNVLIPGVGGDYTKGIVKTIAGQAFVGGKADGDGLTEASFKAQGELIMDSEGAFYVADGVNHIIRKVTPVK